MVSWFFMFFMLYSSWFMVHSSWEKFAATMNYEPSTNTPILYHLPAGRRRPGNNPILFLKLHLPGQ
jgi:hypothetical protein